MVAHTINKNYHKFKKGVENYRSKNKINEKDIIKKTKGAIVSTSFLCLS